MTNESYTLPPAAAPTNHGHTKASWTLVVGAILGALIIGIGLATGQVPVWAAGIVITAGALLASWVMRLRGLGQPVSERTRRDWYAQ